ncbi:hypothetical protein HPP92_027847 [Vanilla planifolia]|uniref:Uncharacterized protein n=1 Tax=Vanilla planifolia TaxID=51239 RepID=A0A835PAB2_VANPL|nr:hypothetical protein HPP92_027847 [Vanilla planifolia]
MAYARVTQVGQSHMRHDTNLPVTSREMNIWHDCGLKNSSMSLTRGTKTNRERVVRQSDKSFIDVRFIKKSHSSQGKSHDVHVPQPHRTNQNGDYEVKDQHYSPTDKVSREVKIASTLSSRGDWTRRPPNYKHHYRCYTAFGRDSLQTRQIWEPMDATRKKYVKSNLDIDVTLSNAAMIQCSEEIRLGRDHESSTQDCISEHSTNAGKVVSSSLCQIGALTCKDSHESDCGIPTQNGHQLLCCLKDMPVEIDNKSSRNNLHPIMVSSSDNCSSCTSEVDSSSSSSISSNMETLSTSDSENASQHSDGRDNATSNGSSFPGNQNISPSHQLGTVEAALTQKPFTTYTEASLQKEDPKKGSINSFGAVFKYEIAPPQLQIPEMNHQLPLSRLPSEVLDYHNQNPVSWSGSPNISSCLPFSQQDLCLFPSPIGYGLHRFPEYGMQFSTLQSPATTAPFHLKQHQVHHGTSGVYDANTKTQLKGANGWTQKLANEAAELTDWSSENKESASELTSSIKLASNSNIMADESSKPFSLFHFGGPLFDSAACVVNRESGDTITFSKEETKMEEYSLFAAGSSSRFLFSSFTL